MLALRRLLDTVTTWAAGLAALCVGATALAYAAEVIARYFLNAPLNWSADFGSFMLCVSVFLALPKVTAEGAHPSISFAVDRLRGSSRARYARLLFVVAAVVVAIVCFFVAQEAWRQFEQGVLTSTANQIPRWWLSAAACFGLLLSGVHFLLPPAPAPAHTPAEI